MSVTTMLTIFICILGACSIGLALWARKKDNRSGK